MGSAGFSSDTYVEDGYGAVHAMRPGGHDVTLCGMAPEGACESWRQQSEDDQSSILRPTKAKAVTCEICAAVILGARKLKVKRGFKPFGY